jgi:hypothetical protein
MCLLISSNVPSGSRNVHCGENMSKHQCVVWTPAGCMGAWCVAATKQLRQQQLRTQERRHSLGVIGDQPPPSSLLAMSSYRRSGTYPAAAVQIACSHQWRSRAM